MKIARLLLVAGERGDHGINASSNTTATVNSCTAARSAAATTRLVGAQLEMVCADRLPNDARSLRRVYLQHRATGVQRDEIVGRL
jgi:hypothetical protein